MKPKTEEGIAWSQYELTPTERLRLKRAAFNIGSILLSSWLPLLHHFAHVYFDIRNGACIRSGTKM